ncbi:PIN domain-containing protein [Jiangella gansuensis]|uniref:PIN domain-containing protein n=1 Tax=Jiangella gansuensis TaxID=281473 RepID=UPI00047B750A|nr:PIN domain-containing protein [Jiangella gansuensis]
MIVDTSALLAYFDTDEPQHGAMADVINAATEPLIVSPYVVAELDYLVATRLGVQAELAVLTELAGGAWELPCIGPEELGQIATVIRKYADQQIGAADSSNVVLARRFGTRVVATLDRRHFEVLRPLDGGRFRLVP